MKDYTTGRPQRAPGYPQEDPSRSNGQHSDTRNPNDPMRDYSPHSTGANPGGGNSFDGGNRYNNGYEGHNSYGYQDPYRGDFQRNTSHGGSSRNQEFRPYHNHSSGYRERYANFAPQDAWEDSHVFIDGREGKAYLIPAQCVMEAISEILHRSRGGR